jgi:hypothetical protein
VASSIAWLVINTPGFKVKYLNNLCCGQKGKIPAALKGKTVMLVKKEGRSARENRTNFIKKGQKPDGKRGGTDKKVGLESACQNWGRTGGWTWVKGTRASEAGSGME